MRRLILLLLTSALINACSTIIGDAPTQQRVDAQSRNAELKSEADSLKENLRNQELQLTTAPDAKLWVRIMFDSGRAVVDEATHRTLHALAAKYLAKSPRHLLIVQGFCDNEPIGGYDGSHKPPAHHYHSLLALSEARAVTVAEILMQSGIPKEEIKIEAFGDSHFIAGNNSDSERRKNRRVDVFLVNRQP